MKNLQIISVPPDYITYFIAIRDAKRAVSATQGITIDHKAILVDSEVKIAARYRGFHKAIDENCLEGLKASIPMRAIGDSLRTCYDSNTKGVRKLKAAIVEAQGIRVLKYCPLCGTSLIATYDHYLPASLFPEFAVHPLNLVPCCSTCNSTKGDGWLDQNGRRLFIHAYSDPLPAEAFLKVRLKTTAVTTGVGAVFSILRPPYFSKAAWTLIEAHFDHLRLIPRYTALSNDEIAEILSDCKTYLRAGGTNVRTFLALRATERSDVYGSSHWQAVIMGELAKAPQLEDWISRVN